MDTKNKLYVIFELNGKVVIKEVEIVKETERQYIINCDDVSRICVYKAELETFLNEYIFGFDKERLIALWNQHTCANIDFLKIQLKRTKELLVDRTYREELLQ